MHLLLHKLTQGGAFVDGVDWFGFAQCGVQHNQFNRLLLHHLYKQVPPYQIAALSFSAFDFNFYVFWGYLLLATSEMDRLAPKGASSTIFWGCQLLIASENAKEIFDLWECMKASKYNISMDSVWNIDKFNTYGYYIFQYSIH